MVKMKEDGKVDMIKGRSYVESLENSPENLMTATTPPHHHDFVPPSPMLIISEQFKKLLKQRSRGKQQCDNDGRKIKIQNSHLGCV